VNGMNVRWIWHYCCVMVLYLLFISYLSLLFRRLLFHLPP
jgi:hypothetical protein